MDQQSQQGPAGTSSARKAAGDLAYHAFGRNPKTSAIAFAAMTVLLLVFITMAVVYMNKYHDCHAKKGGEGFLGTTPLGNLSTGNNNPIWHKQMGDAGWGGSMHSSYQPGEARVYGGSAEGGHSMAVTPVGVRSCGGGLGGGVSAAATGEAHALAAVQALDPLNKTSSSAKHMDDEDLAHIMNGGV